ATTVAVASRDNGRSRLARQRSQSPRATTVAVASRDNGRSRLARQRSLSPRATTVAVARAFQASGCARLSAERGDTYAYPRIPRLHHRRRHHLCDARAEALRSEERRVGKECRSRVSPDEYKKKQHVSPSVRKTERANYRQH